MPNTRYPAALRRLHWLVFILVACTLMIIYLHGWSPKGSALRALLKWTHIQFGIVILLLMLPRLLARSRQLAILPIIPPVAHWQTLLLKTVHLALYFLLIATPLLGIASRMWKPAAWDFLGIPLPHVPSPDSDISHQITDIHETFGMVLMYLAGAHAAAALLHHFWRRDNALKRMLPVWRARG